MGENKDKFDPLFVNLILTLQSSAMQHMGKLKNPVTDKVERNLEQAELSIDMLDMLKKKTGGNLTDEESDLIVRSLNELKMNFMDEKMKDEKASAEEDSTEDPEKDESEDETEAEKDESKDETEAEKASEEE